MLGVLVAVFAYVAVNLSFLHYITLGSAAAFVSARAVSVPLVRNVYIPPSVAPYIFSQCHRLFFCCPAFCPAAPDLLQLTESDRRLGVGVWFRVRVGPFQYCNRLCCPVLFRTVGPRQVHATANVEDVGRKILHASRELVTVTITHNRCRGVGMCTVAPVTYYKCRHARQWRRQIMIRGAEFRGLLRILSYIVTSCQDETRNRV
jgi:hypothetical protein